MSRPRLVLISLALTLSLAGCAAHRSASGNAVRAACDRLSADGLLNDVAESSCNDAASCVDSKVEQLDADAAVSKCAPRGSDIPCTEDVPSCGLDEMLCTAIDREFDTGCELAVQKSNACMPDPEPFNWAVLVRRQATCRIRALGRYSTSECWGDPYKPCTETMMRDIKGARRLLDSGLTYELHGSRFTITATEKRTGITYTSDSDRLGRTVDSCHPADPSDCPDGGWPTRDE